MQRKGTHRSIYPESTEVPADAQLHQGSRPEASNPNGIWDDKLGRDNYKGIERNLQWGLSQESSSGKEDRISENIQLHEKKKEEHDEGRKWELEG